MSGMRQIGQRNRRRAWSTAANLLLLAVNAVLLYLVISLVFALVFNDAFHEIRSEGQLLIVVTLYLFSHLLRVLRLALLIGDARISLRAIGLFHFMTSALGLAAPFKLGEVYRVLELGNLTGNFVRATLIIWWERAFDMVFILAILGLAWVMTPVESHAQFLPLVGLTFLFVFGTAIAFFVVPENLRRLSLLIIRRYASERTVLPLRIIGEVRTSIRSAPQIIRYKTMSLLVLSAMIWLAEVACYAIALPHLSTSIAKTLEGVAHFLSEVAAGDTFLVLLNAGRASARHDFDYTAATLGVLAVFGLIAGVSYAALRLRQGA